MCRSVVVLLDPVLNQFRPVAAENIQGALIASHSVVFLGQFHRRRLVLSVGQPPSGLAHSDPRFNCAHGIGSSGSFRAKGRPAEGSHWVSTSLIAGPQGSRGSEEMARGRMSSHWRDNGCRPWGSGERARSKASSPLKTMAAAGLMQRGDGGPSSTGAL